MLFVTFWLWRNAIACWVEAAAEWQDDSASGHGDFATKRHLVKQSNDPSGERSQNEPHKRREYLKPSKALAVTGLAAINALRDSAVSRECRSEEGKPRHLSYPDYQVLRIRSVRRSLHARSIHDGIHFANRGKCVPSKPCRNMSSVYILIYNSIEGDISWSALIESIHADLSKDTAPSR